jgi:outer membrane murein-binding lipoprotein Lpp
MTQKNMHRTLILLGAVATATLTLAGCTGGADAVSPSTTVAPTASVDPSASTPDATSAVAVPTEQAAAVVEEYLTAIQAEQYGEAYALLTDESRALAGSEAQFAESAVYSIVRSEEAAGYLGTGGTIEAGPGPAEGTVLVTAVSDRIADGWLVRDTGAGMRIDDAGVPSTGASPYEWVNPASGPEDVRDSVAVDPAAPAALIFRDLAAEAGVEGPGLVGFPSTITAYLGTVEVPASSAMSDLQARWDIAWEASAPSAETQPLTVAWEVEPGTWRTTTTAVYTE